MNWTERHWAALIARRDGLLRAGVQRTTVIHVNDMQPGDVYIGRANGRRRLKASPFANPFVIGKDGDRAEVIATYRAWLLYQPDLLARLPELAGKRLACWCSPAACHGDVLVELLNNHVARLEAATTYLARRMVRR